VREVLGTEFTAVSPAADLRKLNAEFRAENDKGVLHTLAALRVDKLLGSDNAKCQQEAIDLLKRDTTTLDDAWLVQEALKEWNTELGPFRSLARDRWPEASAFR